MLILGGETSTGEDTSKVYVLEEIAGRARVGDHAIKKLAAAEIEAMQERCRLGRETGSEFGRATVTGVDETLNRDFQAAKYKARIAVLEEDLRHSSELAAERGKDATRLSREVDRLATKLSDTRAELKVLKSAAALRSSGAAGGAAQGISRVASRAGSSSHGASTASMPADPEQEKLLALRDSLAVRENAVRAAEARLELKLRRADESVEAYTVAARERANLQRQLTAANAANTHARESCAHLSERGACFDFDFDFDFFFFFSRDSIASPVYINPPQKLTTRTLSFHTLFFSFFSFSTLLFSPPTHDRSCRDGAAGPHRGRQGRFSLCRTGQGTLPARAGLWRSRGRACRNQPRARGRGCQSRGTAVAWESFFS
jgi:hypothetical protein